MPRRRRARERGYAPAGHRPPGGAGCAVPSPPVMEAALLRLGNLSAVERYECAVRSGGGFIDRRIANSARIRSVRSRSVGRAEPALLRAHKYPTRASQSVSPRARRGRTRLGVSPPRALEGGHTFTISSASNVCANRWLIASMAWTSSARYRTAHGCNSACNMNCNMRHDGASSSCSGMVSAVRI